MAAHHHVDAGDLGDHVALARIADMGDGDDLVDALLGQVLDLRGDRLDVVLDGDVGAGRGDLGRVVGDAADDADLLAAHFDHHRRLDLAVGAGFLVRVHIGADHRELRLVEIGHQRALAVVEFMVAEGDGIRLHLVEEFLFRRALVGGVE